MEQFGIDALIYQGEIYDKMNDFMDDFDFYKRWCEKAAGPVLELCCGTGRLTIPLKKAGINITGLDFTPAMLESAQIKAQKEKISIDLIEGDMRNFRLNKQFAMIFIPFNSLQNTYTRDDIEAVFSSVRQHLLPNGLFIIEIFNPSIHLMVQREKNPVEAFNFTLDDGTAVVVKEQCRYDSAAQINRVTWTFCMNGKETQTRLDMRCLYPLEMDALLHYNHFDVIHKFEYYDETPFTSESCKQLYVCKAKENT